LDCKQKDALRARYKAVNELDGGEDGLLPEEHEEKLKADDANFKAIKGDINQKYGDLVVEMFTENKIEEVTNEVRSKFAPKLVLINHEKALPVDTVCSNLALKFNMLYLSVYQLIKENITKKTALGVKLASTKRNRRFAN
jgi:hypothetical protein